MRFMQIESVLQTKNRSEPAKNRFSVALFISNIKPVNHIDVYLTKTFKQMQVLQKQKEICKLSACILHSVKCWYVLYWNTELFLNKKKTTKYICFLTFKL